MLKARPVAGDIAMGDAFLAELRPFVWRRGLDFATISDIQAMKRRIDVHHRIGMGNAADVVRRIASYNVKLGEGGIREIEFLAQTLQLVWGGRDPTLRVRDTLSALRRLTANGRIDRATARGLSAAYRFSRTVEHRIQMVHDRQTHSIPTNQEDIRRLAIFLGYPDAKTFAAVLLAHAARVRRHYAEVFDTVPDLPGSEALRDALDFRGDTIPEDTAAKLLDLGFRDVAHIGDAVRRWQAGHIRAVRSERGRQILERILPAIFASLARQSDPDLAFSRFDAFLGGFSAGVQVLSLFERNPASIARVAAVLGSAPALADHFVRHPDALAGLLNDEEAETTPPARILRARMTGSQGLEDTIGIVGRAVREADFAIAVATMESRIDADEAGRRRTAWVDAAVTSLFRAAMADFVARNGRVVGGAMAVVLLGKAGGRETMYGSDLDLMLIYDHPETVAESRGARRMPAGLWFVRAAHAVVAAITARGIDGPLYEVDMRLRPSGNKGPVAVSLSSFERYHAEDAWTWERMALTRARVIAGPAHLVRRIEATIRDTLRSAGDPRTIRDDVRDMRQRLARDMPPKGAWDVKYRVGGSMEVEFVAQTLQLIAARDHPEVLDVSTGSALAKLTEAGLLDRADSELLIGAGLLWRTMQGMLRVLVGRSVPEDIAPSTALPLMHAVRAMGIDVADIAGLRRHIDEVGTSVRAVFERVVGPLSGRTGGDAR